MSSASRNAVRAAVSPIPAQSGRGRPALAVGRRLAAAYLEEEFFVEGTASSFAPTGPLSTNGQWTVEPTASAPFRTRVIVRRPRSADTFNGTVLVEWLNVSSGQDADPDWRYLGAEICRSGYAYVGVSAQQVGISGRQGGDDLAGKLMQGMRLPSLVESDEARYGSLVHPGDAFAYDIFSAAARALRADTVILEGLQPTNILAIGESQAAAHLTTYVNGLAQRDRLFDGFLIHSRGSGAALWDPTGTDFSMVGPGVRLRTDLGAPGADVRNRNRCHPARFRRCPPTGHRSAAHLGSCRHRARRCVSHRGRRVLSRLPRSDQPRPAGSTSCERR